MLLLRFIHDENSLTVGNKEYKATCPVRNNLNSERKEDQIVKTFPLDYKEGRKAYYPRKFPTGLWQVQSPVWTDDIDYAPVKIPTNAVRNVLTYEVKNGKYSKINGTQKDAFYHLHFAKNSSTTLGCIRLNSAKEAKEIAKTIEKAKRKKEEVWIEVIASKDCDRG